MALEGRGLETVRILILGSKEYPLGTSTDALRSGGFEVYTQSLAEHLKGRVERVIVITRRFEGTQARELKDRIEVWRVPWIRGFYLRNPSFNLAAFCRGLFLEFDVVLAQGPVASLFGWILKSLRRRRLVTVPAGVAYVQPQYGWVARKVIYVLERIAYLGADAVVFLSEAEKEQFKRKMGFLPERHVVIPPGVELRRESGERAVQLREELGLKGKVVIAFVGRLLKVKGVEELVEAAKELPPQAALLIVGDGPERKRLEAIARELGLSGRIRFTGWRGDVPALLAVSDIFALPSYSEGLPISLLEAMAAGCACVVTDIGLPVEDEVDALVVQPGDVSGLRKAMERLVVDPELRRRLGERAREKARAEFTWTRAVESYLKLFTELCPESSS